MPGLSQIDALLEIVGDLYAGALQPEQSMTALQGMNRWLRGTSAQVISFNRDTGEVLDSQTDQSIPERLNDEYVAHWSKIDPRPKALAGLPSGQVVRCHELFDDGYVARDPYYQDFFIPAGFRWAVGGALHGDDGVSTIVANLRAPDLPHYSAQDALFVKRLLPHVRRAAAMRASFAARPSPATMIETLVGTMPQPCAVIDARAVVRTQSSSARELLPVLGISLSRGKFAFDAAAQQEQWSAVLARVRRTGLAASFAAGARDGSTWKLHVLPWRSFGLARDALDDALQLVNFERVSVPPQASAQELAARFGLTPAETAVLVLLAKGLRAKEIARERGASPYTVRDQIASMLAKTGCGSQVELLSKLK